MTSPSIPNINGRPIVLLPEGYDWDGWKHLGADARAWQQWRSDYYLGVMACPFSIEAVEPITGRWILRAPHGMSVHGVPKLHPADK